MKPDFENNSTFCLCFEQKNYPINICSFDSNFENKLWKVTPIENVIASSTSNSIKLKKNIWWKEFLNFLEESHNGMGILLIILIFGLITGLSISIICLKQMKHQRKKNQNGLAEQFCRINENNELEPLPTTTIETNNF